MRYLLISCFLIAIVSCASYPKKQALTPINTSKKLVSNTYFSNSNLDYVYKASIQVYNNNFSGLLIIKKIADKNHRIVFTTEMGKKLFDFSILENEFQVNYILNDLNNKVLIKILKADFKTLTQEQNSVLNVYSKNDINIYETTMLNKMHYYYFSDKLEKIVRTKHQKEKVHFLFSDISNNIANQIDIIHDNIALKIGLKFIK